MPYSIDTKDYPEDEVRKVAQMHFVDRRAQSEIADVLRIPRGKVVAMCDAARRDGWVRVAIMPSRTVENEHLRELASRVREKFGLLDCIIVSGRIEMRLGRLEDNFREMIVDDIARKAAIEVVRRFREAQNPYLAVSYGFISRKMTDSLIPTEGLNPEGRVIAAQGVRRNEMDRFDANDVVRDLAIRFGCRYACMPAPAVIDRDAVPYVSRLDLVEEVLTTLQTKTNIVLTSLGSLQDTQGATLSGTAKRDSLGTDLSQKLDMNVIRAKGGIGNIGGWFFDGEGNEVDDGKHAVLGLQLDTIRRCVRGRRPVILAVGADPGRIPAIAIALRTDLASIYVGDEISARILLGQYNIESHEEVRWSDAETEVLRSLRK